MLGEDVVQWREESDDVSPGRFFREDFTLVTRVVTPFGLIYATYDGGPDYLLQLPALNR